jgi:hypothetical protein
MHMERVRPVGCRSLLAQLLFVPVGRRLLYAALPLLAACSSGSPGDSTSDAAACQTGSNPVDTYMPGLTKQGTNADGSSAGLKFVLVGTSPSPPGDGTGSAGTNTWTVKVEDASGQPVKDAVVSLPSDASPYGDPWMPVHRHGSSILPMVTNNGDGTATLVMNFFMPGLWNVHLRAQSGSTTAGATFAFCTY